MNKVKLFTQLVFAIYVIVFILWAISPARADDVALARVCIAEAGWDVIDTGECVAIADVIQARAATRGTTFIEMLRAYSSAHFSASRSTRRWVVGLRADGQQPVGWPPQMRWSRFRGRWLETIVHAGKVLRGEVASPCDGRSDHWGGAMDDHRAHRAGWTRVMCASGVRNHFWRVARRGDTT